MFKKIPGCAPGLGAGNQDDGETSSPTRTTSKEYDYATTEAVIDLLCQQWPKAFFKYQARCKPLKLNIDHDILLLLDGCVSFRELKCALGCYTSNFGYLKSCRCGVERVGLDGLPCGEVTKEEAEYCRQKITARNNGSGRPYHSIGGGDK